MRVLERAHIYEPDPNVVLARDGSVVAVGTSSVVHHGLMGGDANLAAMLSEAARMRPGEPALWCAGRSLTWAQADALASDLARGVRSMGLQPGERLGLLLGNSIEFVISYFGALRAGLVVVPMNPAYTAAEVAVLLADAGVRAVICESTTAAVAAQAADAIPGCETIEVGSASWTRLLDSGTAAAAPAADRVPVDPDTLALLLFTAGTSGRPKGVMLTHGALRANIDALRLLNDPPPVLPTDVVYVVLPMFHVYGLNTVLGLAVSAGARCVIDDRFEPREALRLITEHGVTTVAGAPAMYRAWAAVPDLREAVAGVRLFSSGGSSLPPAVFEAFAEASGATIYEGYGMTETAPVVTTTLVGGQPKPGSVGRPIPSVQVRLVDPDGEPADEGDPGEVCVRGPSVFLGYWPDAVGGPDQQGWFRSRGRRLPGCRGRPAPGRSSPGAGHRQRLQCLSPGDRAGHRGDGRHRGGCRRGSCRRCHRRVTGGLRGG